MWTPEEAREIREIAEGERAGECDVSRIYCMVYSRAPVVQDT